MGNWTSEELETKLKDNPELKIATTTIFKDGRVKHTFVKQNKYHVADKIDRTYNGIVYHSKKEAKFASQLDLSQKAGDIDFWLGQVPFALPGKAVYRLDFVTFKEGVNCEDCEIENRGYEVHWIEVKGFKTPVGELKRKQASEIYGINIEVV